MTKEAAEQLAEHLNGAIEAHHARTPPNSRKVVPPKQVVVKIRELFVEGRLDWWVKEADGWKGRVTLIPSGQTAWYPAADLKETNPASSR